MISTARGSFTLFNLVALALLGAAIGGPAANAQATLGETAQTLDRVDIIYATDADNIEIDTIAPGRPWVSNDYGLQASTSFTQCQNTATLGIYCLDGNTVKRFPNPSDTPAQVITLFDCSNPAFRFNQRAACDTLTVDITGTMWLAAAKGPRFSLFKVIQTSTAPDFPASPSQWTRFTTAAGTFFTREYATGRPQLKDLAVIDGDVAAAFPLGSGMGGVIAVEQKSEVTFFPDSPGATPVLLGNATTWGLGRDSKGKLTEAVQSATLLQKYFPATPNVTPADDTTRNWLLITTSTGRLLSREIPWNAPITAPAVTQASLAAPLPVPAMCSGLDPFYDIQTSVKSRSIYASDRRGCRALGLTTNVDDAGFSRTTNLVFNAPVVIASTSPSSTATPIQAALQAPPEGVSIAPGSALNMAAECVPGKVCPLVGDGADADVNVPAASMTNVQLDVNSPDGLVVFQIKNIPDCRYFNTVTSPPPAACLASNVMFKADGTPVTYAASGGVPEPHKVFLNVRPLLPLEITRVKTLPARMLLSPRYKALTPKGRNTFDALFGIAEPGVRFRETFDANFDLEDLLGPNIKLGCGGEDLPERLINTTAGPQLDIVVTISEDYTTVGGLTNGGRQHTDMLVNSDGCDPTDPPLSGTRWSMFAYGLMMTPDLDDPTAPTGVRYSDSILAKLTLSLFKDLGETIDTYACLNNDGGTGVPVSATDCTNLKAGWFNTNDKLTKCVESSTEPLNSTEIRTCNAFEVQYAPFATLVNGLLKAPTASDPANRVGELKARLEVFRYVYLSQFQPSIPANTGFNDPL